MQLLDFLQFVGLVVLTASLTRLVRQSEAASGLRMRLAATSAVGAALLRCAHCVSFWLALALTVILAVVRHRLGDPLGWVEGPLFVLLGWRGAYYLNLQIDRRAESSAENDPQRQQCVVCGKRYVEGFLQRGGVFFCSLQCWFGFLKNRPASYNKLFTAAGEVIRQEIYPMSYRDISSGEAHELMESDQGYTYIDVRSVPEFANGHPAGAINVPIMHREEMGMVPNPDFLRVLEVHFERDARLVIGCQSGGRSARAAEVLVAAGFTDVANVRGGFGGARDEMGQVLEKGWFELGLPVDYGDPDGRNYGSLAGGGGGP